MKKLIKDLGTELEIHKHVRNIIYFSHKFNTNDQAMNEANSSADSEEETEKNENKSKESDSSLHIIKQYNLCKRFIVANSIPLELYSDTQRKSSTRDKTERNADGESEDISEDDTDEHNIFIQRTTFKFPIDAQKLVKRIKIKKKRVVDASKVIRMIEEIEERQNFRHILKYISHDVECLNVNKIKKQRLARIAAKNDQVEPKREDFKDCKVIKSDFEIMMDKLSKTKIDLSNEINTCMVRQNYEAMQGYYSLKS